MPKWTPAQQNAIDARGCNILISAAAGSGKTAVLVQRVINLITDDINPVDVDRLLIVTFTNAAAAEMKSRIAKSLANLLSEQPNNTNVQKQISLLPNAKICTIDSFCMNLVRENFFKLDISQDFKVLDNSELLLIEQNAVDEVVNSLYEEDKEDFKLLVELLSSAKNDSDFSDAIKRINNYIMAQPFPIEWLNGVCESYNPKISLDETWMKEYVFGEIRYYSSFIKEIVRSSQDMLSPDDELFEGYSNLLLSDLSIAENMENALSGTWDNMKSVIENISYSKMPSKRGYISDAKAVITANRKLMKSVISSDIQPIITVTSEEYERDCEYLYPILKLLIQIIADYNKKMFEIKKEMNSYSFSDIEHFAIQLLFSQNSDGEILKTDLAMEYEDNFEEILVDEYQDTNSAQDKLFEMLSNGHNRFMVGDVKQSIYRFRLAMPQIFNNKKDTFSDYHNGNTDFDQRIILDKNFRSRKGICDYTNFVFSHLMSKKIGEMDYTESEYLNNGAEYTETNISSAQIKIVQPPDNMDSDEYEAMQTAQLILDKIASKEQIKDKEEYRNIRFSDFAVLFRSAKSRLPVFTKVFTEFGIPVISNNKVNLFENNEVAILISLLKVIDNPVQDIPLLATLMSVFYGYSADDIARARVNHKCTNLYASICADKERFSVFLNDLDRYRKYAASMSVENFLRQIISETSYLSVISAMGNCEQRRLNVLKLIDIAKNFDNGDNVGLTAFMRYVDSIINSKLDVESASLSHVGEDAVSLMSIHQSKGLEFPVCIFAGTGHKYNTEDLKDLIQLNSDAGIGLKINNEAKLYRYNSVQYTCIKNINSCASMSENLRVLYVAMTRAKEQFISFITLKEGKKHIDSLSSKITNNSISPAVAKHISSDADFLLLCALLHKDGKKLRECCSANITVEPFADFDMSIDFPGEIDKPDFSEETVSQSNPEIVEQITERLKFSYERQALSGYSSKRTASSLDEKEQSYKFFAKSKPAFLNSAGMTAAEKGTAMHAFMQYCDYTNAKTDLEKEIKRLSEMSFITHDQAKSLNRAKLNNLFQGDFAKRMFESDNIYREIKVSSFVPVNELEDTDYSDKVLIQGIADCVFEENGELILVDYKTDQIDSEEELLELYKNQIGFYKRAVAKTLGKPVKQAMLYSFCLDKECIYK
ncbi:MAG: helicase-exonuclease AddAB subunit AddA [Eubacterium sp.]